MQRLQQLLTSFKHKTAKACPPEQCGVPLHLRGHFKKWRGTTKNLRRYAPDMCPRYSFRRHCPRSTVEQCWAM